MQQTTRTTLTAAAVLATLAILAATWGWLTLVATNHTHHVNGFSFTGHGSLGVDAGWSSRGPETVGRRDPIFEVRTLRNTARSRLLREEHSDVEIAGYPAIQAEGTTFAPGHGGRDHDIAIYIPELDAGVIVYFRTHEEDHDASLQDRFEAWRSQRWAREVISSLDWTAGK